MRSRGATAELRGAVVIVFARAPVPGRVKTRLAAAIGAEQSARVYARLIERTLATALAARIGAVELHCAPHTRHPFFSRLAKQLGVLLRPQRGRDLGERMHHALAAALGQARAALLVGSDCPGLSGADLRAALRALQAGADAVFSPARDGGYVLVGLRASDAALFRGIDWGGPGVMAATRKRLRALGWRWRELRELWDVDRPADYARLRRIAPEILSTSTTRR